MLSKKFREVLALGLIGLISAAQRGVNRQIKIVSSGWIA